MGIREQHPIPAGKEPSNSLYSFFVRVPPPFYQQDLRMSKSKSKQMQWLRMAAVLILCVACILLPANKRADASKKRLSAQFKSLLEDGRANYLDALEKEVILHLNMARTDPGKYAKKYIAPRKCFFDGNIYHDPRNPQFENGYRTHEGLKAVRECVNVMKKASPVEALLPSERISIAAQAHARYQSRTGSIGHVGPDGSKPGTRLRQFGSWRITGENLSYGFNTASEIVACLLVDDGVRNRKHRSIILDPQFSIVGVAIEPHPVYQYVCVINFAGG